MGNFFNKKQVWQEKLQTIKTELADLDKRKAERALYQRQTNYIFCCCLVPTLIIATILAALSYFHAALVIFTIFVILCLCIKYIIPFIFNHLTKQDEEKIVKLSLSKARLVKEIKNTVPYTEAKSVLSGHDPEIDRTNDAVIDLEPLIYKLIISQMEFIQVVFPVTSLLRIISAIKSVSDFWSKQGK